MLRRLPGEHVLSVWRFKATLLTFARTRTHTHGTGRCHGVKYEPDSHYGFINSLSVRCIPVFLSPAVEANKHKQTAVFSPRAGGCVAQCKAWLVDVKVNNIPCCLQRAQEAVRAAFSASPKRKRKRRPGGFQRSDFRLQTFSSPGLKK